MKMKIRQLRSIICYLTLLSLCLSVSSCRKETTTYYQGYLEAEYVYISSETEGILQELAVKRGDWIEQNTLLFQLDATPLQAQRDQAYAQLQQAQSQTADLIQPMSRPSEIAAQEAAIEQQAATTELSAIESKRQRELMRDNATTEDNYDQARYSYRQNQAALKQTQAQLETAQLSSRSNQIQAAQFNKDAANKALVSADWSLDQTRKAAPTYSFVYDTLYRVGEFVPSGNPVVTLLPPGNIKLRFFVPQLIAQDLKMGQHINFKGPDGQSTPASINYISPQPEFTPPVIFSRDTSAKLVFMVEAAIEKETAKKLHPGQPVEVHL